MESLFFFFLRKGCVVQRIARHAPFDGWASSGPREYLCLPPLSAMWTSRWGDSLDVTPREFPKADPKREFDSDSQVHVRKEFFQRESVLCDHLLCSSHSPPLRFGGNDTWSYLTHRYSFRICSLSRFAVRPNASWNLPRTEEWIRTIFVLDARTIKTNK